MPLALVDAGSPGPGDVDAAPIATVEPPRRVPGGIHGSWIPDVDLEGGR